MNFNRTSKNTNDYDLKTKLIAELISLYGVECDFLFTEKMNVDKVMQEFSHLKLEPNQSRKITVLPENSEEFDGELQWGMFGLDNLQTTYLFVSRKDLERLYPDFDINGFSKILNQLLVFPSGNIQEITDISWENPGVNNLFVNQETKSVYKLTTRAYSNSKQNDIEDEPLEEIDDSIKDIDDYFASLDNTTEEIKTEADTKSNTDSVFGNLS